MSHKRQLRFNKDFRYIKPQIPKVGKKSIVEEVLKTTGDRCQYFPNGTDHDLEYEEDELYIPNPYQYISLKDVIDLVNKENLSLEDVFFTASRCDDYINLEIIYRKKLSEEETIQQYEEDMKLWNQEQNYLKQQELERIEREIRYLQEKSKTLQIK